MARTTTPEVQAILPAGNSVTTTQIDAIIPAASSAVDQIADCVSSTVDLKQVETWLAAHMCVPFDPAMSRTSEKDACGGSTSYSLQSGSGVMSTSFGQMANTLSGGWLLELDKTQAIGFVNVGYV